MEKTNLVAEVKNELTRIIKLASNNKEVGLLKELKVINPITFFKKSTLTIVDNIIMHDNKGRYDNLNLLINIISYSRFVYAGSKRLDAAIEELTEQYLNELRDNLDEDVEWLFIDKDLSKVAYRYKVVFVIINLI